LFAEAQRSATNAETQHQASRGTAENLNTLLVSAQATKAAMDSNASVVERLRQQCEEYAATAKKLADKADSTQERIITYEARLEDLQSRSDERLKAIEGLLPGATSVGLAFAFNQRRAHFIVPQRFWQTVFVGSLAGLMCLAWWEFGWHSVP
jgi:ABC-type transporter Mla subunit MlaD